MLEAVHFHNLCKTMIPYLVLLILFKDTFLKKKNTVVSTVPG